jgi:hypothetical protein
MTHNATNAIYEHTHQEQKQPYTTKHRGYAIAILHALQQYQRARSNTNIHHKGKTTVWTTSRNVFKQINAEMNYFQTAITRCYEDTESYIEIGIILKQLRNIHARHFNTKTHHHLKPLNEWFSGQINTTFQPAPTHLPSTPTHNPIQLLINNHPIFERPDIHLRNA